VGWGHTYDRIQNVKNNVNLFFSFKIRAGGEGDASPMHASDDTEVAHVSLIKGSSIGEGNCVKLLMSWVCSGALPTLPCWEGRTLTLR
jgi:hypothetical protein